MKTDNRPPFLPLNGCDPAVLFKGIETPAYIIDETQLIKNGKILSGIAKHTGARMLIAQKAFSNYDLYPVLSPYAAGTESSGLYEARLGKEELPDKEVHVYCAAFKEKDMPEIIEICDHIVFNSPCQLKKYGPAAKAAGKSVGLRINPELSTQDGHEIYDPCSPGSRMGTTRASWDEFMTPELIGILDGLHFHTLCEQDSDDLARTLPAVEEKFGEFLQTMRWVNFGGGHHITRPGYNIELLEKCIDDFRKKWDVDVYLEPGEAWALNAGYLVTRVLDLPKNGETGLAILDMSAACHTPDVLEMPYRPPLYNAGEPGEKTNTYRLGGPTCLSGDVIGEFSFDEPLFEGQMLTFGDMAIYTTCKNNTFNGMPLPDIWVRHADGALEKLTNFGYEDFRMRLGRNAHRQND